MNVNFLTAFFGPSISLSVTWVILHFLWQGTAIGCVIALANLVVGNRSPRLRYTFALSGLLLMFATVITTWHFLKPPHVDAVTVIQAQGVLSNPILEFESALTSSDVVAVDAILPAPSIAAWAPTTAAIYAAGVTLMLLRLAFAAIGVVRLRFFAHPVGSDLATRAGDLSQRLGLRVRPVMKVCSRIVVPFVAGVVKPAVLLPPFVVTGMTPAELDAILMHELAHIRRGDLFVNFLQRVAESLLFFHPVVWYVSRVITIEREKCCDDLVLGHCSQRDYASALVHLAEACAGTRQEMEPIAALAATGASPSQLKRRVMRILGVKSTRRFTKPGICVVIVCILGVTAAVVHLQAQTETATTPTQGTATADASEELADPANHTGTDPTVAQDSLDHHPVKISLDGEGNVAGFSISLPGDGGMARFAAMLKQLSENKRVSITSTNIVRENSQTTMTVVGTNLDLAMVRELVDLTAGEGGKGSVVATASPANGASELARPMRLRNEAASFLGPVRIDRAGDSIIMRGNEDDLERVKAIIEEIERVNKLDEQRRHLSELKAKDIQLKQRYGSDHPIRKALQDEIEQAERMVKPSNEKTKDAKARRRDRYSVFDLGVPNAKENIDINSPIRVELVDDGIMIFGKEEIVDRVRKQLEKVIAVAKNENNEVTIDDKVSANRNVEKKLVTYYLRHVNAEELQAVLFSLFGDQIRVQSQQNRIVVQANGDTQESVGKVLEQIDIAPPDNESLITVSYQLRFVEAAEMEQLIRQVYDQGEKKLKVAAEPRTNQMIVAASREDHDGIRELIKQVDRIAERQNPPTPVLGILFGTTADAKDGVAVRSVIKGSRADAGGIQAGDVLLRCAGQEVTPQNLQELVNQHKGQAVKLVLQRDGMTGEIQLQLSPTDSE